MTLDDVLQELIQIVSSKGDDTISWELVRQWPKNAIEIFQNAGWIKPKAPAKSVVCPGCQENCFMPVHSTSLRNDQPAKYYVACDQRDDMGRVPISPELFQQWQITGYQVAQWVAQKLGLKGKPQKDRKTGMILIGSVQGKKRTSLLEFTITEQTSLKSSGNSLPLTEVVYFKNNQLLIERTAILKIVDRPPNANQYDSSIARREARKLKTQEMHKSWQKEYQKLKKNKPDESDNWCALQIAKMPISQGKDSETIRKNMKN